MAKRIFRQFKMDEISGVDFPCQEGAKVTIFKRAPEPSTKAPELTVLKVDDSVYMKLTKRSFNQAQRDDAAASGAAMPGGRYPIESKDDLKDAIRAVGRGKGSHAAIRAHIMRRARSLGATDLVPDDWKAEKGVQSEVLDQLDAATRLGKAMTFAEQQAGTEQREFAQGVLDELNEAVCTLTSVFYEIAGDETVTDKPAAMKQALVEFSDHVKSIAPEGIETGIVAAAMQQAGYTVNEQGGVELTKDGADPIMSKLTDLAKALGLSVAKDASDDDVIKAIAADALAKEKAKKEGEEDDVEKLRKYADALEKMSAKHSAFIQGGGKMPKGGKEAFASMSTDDRDDHMEKNPITKADDSDDDEVEKRLIKSGGAFKDFVSGVVLYKKDFSNKDHFRVMKANSDAAAKSAIELAKLRDEGAVSVVTKSVEKLKHVGKADEIAALVHKVSKADPEAGAAVLKLLEGLDGTIEKSGLLGEVGSAAQGRVGKAASTIDTMAKTLLDERRKTDKKFTIEKAKVEIRRQNPELRKQEDGEAADARQKMRRAA